MFEASSLINLPSKICHNFSDADGGWLFGSEYTEQWEYILPEDREVDVMRLFADSKWLNPGRHTPPKVTESLKGGQDKIGVWVMRSEQLWQIAVGKRLRMRDESSRSGDYYFATLMGRA